MDKKRTFLGMTLAMGFFIAWYFLMTYVNEKYPPAPPIANQPAPAAPTTAPIGPAGSTQPATGQAFVGATGVSPGLSVMDAADNAAFAASLGSARHKDADYAIELKTQARGAGVDTVVLNGFLAAVDDPSKTPYHFQEPQPAVLATYGHALATRSITVNGQVVDVSAINWKFEGPVEPGRAAYSVTLGTAGDPVLKVRKTFRVFKRNDPEHGGLGYEVRVDHDFDNLSGKSLSVSMQFNGPAMPPRELTAGPDQRVMVGYQAGPNIQVDNHYVEYLNDEDTTKDYVQQEDKLPLYWVGASSIYFQAIMMPPVWEPAAGQKQLSVASFKSIGLAPESSDPQPVALVADTIAMPVGANQTLNYPVSVFFGPKHREVLNTPFYAGLPRDFDQTLVVRAGPCAMCTFDWLINFLVGLLGVFHTMARDWGLAIICLVILVRLALHPITKRSQVSMMKMGKMGPEMERLRKKYGDNKEELQKAMWEFQKQQGFTPILGCLPMFLQMPIWIALWSALNTTFELRHSSFLWGFTWIDDLAKPDRLIPFPAAWAFRIPLIGTVVDAVNVLPMLLAVVFYLQQKYTPKPPTMTKEQEQQQKIMQWMMVFLFPLFLYGQPSGLNLYILTSTAIGIWESKRIRRHIKEKEEAEKAGVVIVDAEPVKETAGGKGKKKEPINIGGKGGKGGGKPAAPQGWLARKLAELQEKAENVRREAERRGRDRA
jgi:YidC/Oxa1 family membrane protein insertase